MTSDVIKWTRQSRYPVDAVKEGWQVATWIRPLAGHREIRRHRKARRQLGAANGQRPLSTAIAPRQVWMREEPLSSDPSKGLPCLPPAPPWSLGGGIPYSLPLSCLLDDAANACRIKETHATDREKL